MNAISPSGAARRHDRRKLLLGFSAAFFAASTFPDLISRASAQGFAPMEMGAGDTGILNFAYALEQLEAAFYTQVLATPYRGMDRFEYRVLRDVRDHEVAHVQFFRRALGPNAIGDVPVNFGAIDFSSRESVLKTAMTFEDVGVSAYNGAGQHLRDPANLLAAGKIVSVEARHAAALRDLLYPYSSAFAGDDVVNELGLDVERDPASVARLVQPYIAVPLVPVRVG